MVKREVLYRSTIKLDDELYNQVQHRKIEVLKQQRWIVEKNLHVTRKLKKI